MRLPDPERSRIVLVGSSRYDHDSGFADLPTVRQNLTLLAEILPKRTGIAPTNIRVVLDPVNYKAVRAVLRPAAAEAQDLLLFYFAGHGVMIPDSVGLTCYDSELDDPEPTTVKYDWVRKILLESGAATRFVILDCCHSGNAHKHTLGAEQANQALEERARIRNSYVLTSTASGYKNALADGANGCTAFTGALVDILRKQRPGDSEYLTMSDVFRRLREKLGEQNLPLPMATGRGFGSEIALARNSVAIREAEPASLPPLRTASILTPLTSRDIIAAPLPAFRSEWEYEILSGADALPAIAERVGGPFHLIYPPQILNNIRKFQKTFADYSVAGHVYYSKKANKAACVVTACVEAGCGVVVSSVGDLTDSLHHGVAGDALMVAGPAKSNQLLELATEQGALIAIDSLEELSRLSELDKPSQVLLRVLPYGSNSRFGLTADEVNLALSKADPKRIMVKGFSFQLTSYEPTPHARMAHDLITECKRARQFGHPADTISIGDGFGVDHVSEWDIQQFHQQANPGWYHDDRAHRLGLDHPNSPTTTGTSMLSAILDDDDLGVYLREENILLAIEPGRALLDGAGSTVFRVQGIKVRTIQGLPYTILTVDGTSRSLSEEWLEGEYMPDPILWSELPREEISDEIIPTCIGGSSGFEDDMVSWRRIPLPRNAIVGDFLYYSNTAGYQSDPGSSFHGVPNSPQIVLNTDGDRRLVWQFDSDFSLAPRAVTRAAESRSRRWPFIRHAENRNP